MTHEIVKGKGRSPSFPVVNIFLQPIEKAGILREEGQKWITDPFEIIETVLPNKGDLKRQLGITDDKDWRASSFSRHRSLMY